LQTTPVVEETIPNVFDSVVEVLNECPDETDALAECYGRYGIMETCGKCAWTRILNEMNQGCIDINEIASPIYQACIDTPIPNTESTYCNNECNDEAIAVWNCARPLYCTDLDKDLSFEARWPCFSLESTVEVQGKGTTSIKDLVIGDMVLSDDKGTYTMYYSKGHFSEDTPSTYLRIFTETSNKKPLELSENHLVYKVTEALPVPARSIKVGDVLKTIGGPTKVTFIKKVTRKGFSSPYTMSGSIVVDGVVASTFTESQGFEGQEPGWGYLMNRKIIHWHHLSHFVLAPHRMVCGKLMSCNEKLNEDGYVPYVNYLLRLLNIAVEKQSTLFTLAALSFMVVQCGLFALIEVLLQHAFGCVLVVLGIAARKWFITKKANSNPKFKVN
jgi:hypothetical protein